MDITFESEKELEDTIFLMLEEGGGCCPLDGYEWDFYCRQMDLGVYGRPDIVKYRIDFDGDKSKIVFSIIEIKKDKVNELTLSQCARYCVGIKQYAEACGIELADIIVNLQVVAPSISMGDFTFLLSYLDDSVDVFSCDFHAKEGLVFNEVSDGWFISKASPPSSLESLLMKADNDRLKMDTSFRNYVESKVKAVSYDQ